MRRFSIKSLIGLLTFLAVVLALATTMRTNWRLEKELVALRREGGHLGDVDTTKFNVAPVPQHDRNKYQWRVYVPEGRRIRINYHQANVPATGLPEPDNGSIESLIEESPLHGSLLTASINARGQGESELRISFGGTASYTKVPEDAHPNRGGTTMRCGRETTDLHEPLVLLRRRCAPITTGPTGPIPGAKAGPMPGLMIWIELAE